MSFNNFEQEIIEKIDQFNSSFANNYDSLVGGQNLQEFEEIDEHDELIFEL